MIRQELIRINQPNENKDMKINNFVAKHSLAMNKGGVHAKDNKALRHKRQRKNMKAKLNKGRWE